MRFAVWRCWELLLCSLGLCGPLCAWQTRLWPNILVVAWKSGLACCTVCICKTRIRCSASFATCESFGAERGSYGNFAWVAQALIGSAAPHEIIYDVVHWGLTEPLLVCHFSRTLLFHRLIMQRQLQNVRVAIASSAKVAKTHHDRLFPGSVMEERLWTRTAWCLQVVYSRLSSFDTLEVVPAFAPPVFAPRSGQELLQTVLDEKRALLDASLFLCSTSNGQTRTSSCKMAIRQYVCSECVRVRACECLAVGLCASL